MGGNASRMVKEIVSDSLYIMRETNRESYQRSVAHREEAAHKLQALRKISKEILDSDAAKQQKLEVFKSLEHGVDMKKQHLEHVSKSFLSQFELSEDFRKLTQETQRQKQKPTPFPSADELHKVAKVEWQDIIDNDKRRDKQ